MTQPTLSKHSTVVVLRIKLQSHQVHLTMLQNCSAVAEMGDRLATIYTGRKFGDCASYGGKLDPRVTQCGLSRGLPSYQVASWSIQPFGHNRHGPKIQAGSAPFFTFWGGGAGSPSNTVSLGPRPTSLPSGVLIYPAIWPQQKWAKIGGVPLWRGGAESPYNTVWPGPRPTSMPSFIFIHPTVWPQCTNVTDRQDGTDRPGEW